jgi:phosphoribosylglycinamide formyltransferase-1
MAIPHNGLSRREHELRLLAELDKYKVDFVVLAGYMRILSSTFLRRFSDSRGFYRVINIHPSLLPAFPGKSAYEDAFDSGVEVSGVTIHFVDEKVDHGPILAQESFPRLANDTLNTFTSRGLALEHTLYPRTLQMLVEGKLPEAVQEPVQR